MPPRHLAITMGDPAGIGPEIIVKAAARLRPRIEAEELRLVVIGSNPALEQARARFASEIAIPEVAEQDADWPPLCALQAGPEGEPIQPVSSRPMADALRILPSSAACNLRNPAAWQASSPRRSIRRR